MERLLIVAGVVGLSAAWMVATATAIEARPAPVLVQADPEPPADAAADTKPAPGTLKQQQPADEPVTPLHPKAPRTDAEQKRLDALAHFMTGELFLERDKTAEGLQELQKAIELNPVAIEPYRLYIPSAVREGKLDDA